MLALPYRLKRLKEGFLLEQVCVCKKDNISPCQATKKKLARNYI